tara:strand:- start:2549 stop:2806 length:258 start_codon:yes stop_codon:yes gene_type:complete
MSEKRVIRKLKKLASRIHTKMESVRDEIEDLEIEFELLQQHIKKLESKAEKSPSNSEEITVILEEDDEDEIDLENSSAVGVPRKF